MDRKATLSPPWVLFYKEIEALFKEDPAVRVDYAVDYAAKSYTIRVYVEGVEKAEALMQILPEERAFGDVTAKVMVVPAIIKSPSKLELFQKAFEGNPAFAYIAASDDKLFDFGFVVFKGKVVQYFTDNIGDPNGLKSTLYQDIAKDVFSDIPGIYFCTEPVE